VSLTRWFAGACAAAIAALTLTTIITASSAGGTLSFVSPPSGSALNDAQSIASSLSSCGVSSPNAIFDFASGFVGAAEPNSSLILPSGSEQYLYVGADDGAEPQSSVSWQPDLSVAATYSSNQSISIGRSTSSEGAFSALGGTSVAVAGLAIDGYTIANSFANYRTTNTSTTTSEGGPATTGPSVGVQYDVPTSSDVVILLVGGQGTGLFQSQGAGLSTLVNDTYSECGSNSLASVGVFASTPGVGSYRAEFDSSTYSSDASASLGVVAYVLAPTAQDPPTRPQAPINLRAIPGSGRVKISWSPPLSDGGNRVETYSVTASPGEKTCKVAARPIPQQSCTVLGLSNGRSYSFVARATSAAGTSAPSSPMDDVVPRNGVNVTTLFDDEFSGKTLSSAWRIGRGSNTSNEELECYSPHNISVSGGNLTETAEVGTSCGADCPPMSSTVCPYESGGVQWSTLSFTYGTVTVRAKMAGGTGTWPAIWLLGADCQNPSWLANVCDWPSPGSNEIDIAEVLSSNHNRVNEQIHTTESDGSYFLPNCDPVVNNLEWHTYTLVWAPGSLTWEVDGVETCQMTTLVPTTPMFLIINTAVGGIGAAPVKGSTLPQETEVAYVRVTQPTS
jgi:beta-glucanase (GH16 family)